MDKAITDNMGQNAKDTDQNVKSVNSGVKHERDQIPKNSIFFRKKLSLFLIFLLFIGIAFLMELSFIKRSQIVDIPVFNVVEIDGGVEMLGQNGSLMPIRKGALNFGVGDTLITYENSRLVIEVNGSGLLVLDSQSKLRMDFRDVSGSVGSAEKQRLQTLEKARLYLESGRVWVNNVFNPVEYNFYTNKVLIIPGDAIFEMDYNGSTLNVYNNQHDISVGLLAKSYSELKRIGGVDSLFYNYFFLPEGNKIAIQESKVSEKLATLLLSKLIKEFPISLVLTADLSKDSFYQKNLEKDNELVGRYVNNYKKSLRETLVLKKFSNLQKAYLQSFERNKFPLIISENKAEKSKAEYLAKVFNVGQNWSLSDARNADRSADSYYSFWKSSLGYLNFDSSDYLLSELDELRGVLYTDSLYLGKKYIWDAAFDELKAKKDFKGLIRLLSGNLEEVYDLLDQAEFTQALAGFSQWSNNFDLLLGSVRKDDMQPFYSDIENIRQNVTNLFFRYSDFYVQEHFNTLTFVDQKVLDFSPDKVEQEENRQTMVQDRIKILKKLSFLIENNKIDRRDGVDLGNFMIANVVTLRNQALYRVAIYDFFDSEIGTLKELFEFYDAPEYRLLKGTKEEAFAEFRQRRQDWADLQDYVERVEPGKKKVRRIDTDKLISEVYEQFTDRRIFPGSIGLLGDEQNRLFEIKDGTIGNADFEAIFDNQTKLLYDLEVSGQILTKGVHIDKLREVVNSIILIEKEVGDLPEGEKIRDILSEELNDEVKRSSAENLAIRLVVDELNSIGFFINKRDVDILDLIGNKFFITSVALDEFPYELSFEFDNTNDRLSRVIVNVVTNDKSEKIYLDGEFVTEGLQEGLLDGVARKRPLKEQEPTKVKRKVKRN